MVTFPAAHFVMGSNRHYLDERPTHLRHVDAFHLDRTPVTNAQFAAFVTATGYVTVAERPVPAHLTGGAEDLPPGSMVFTPPERPVDLSDWRAWWSWVPGATWSHPEGPGSDLTARATHPVVHVAFDDAAAYAAWVGCRLPTEAEYEYAAGGGTGHAFAWGDDPYPADGPRANTWIGRFPHDNQGIGGTSPVGSYPANADGLFDMIGNVWEWTTDTYRPFHQPPHVDPDGRLPLLTFGNGSTAAPRRVLKGGSFLCSPDYCLRFRPAARSPQTDDTAMSHIGFRCAADAAPHS
ncbi:formylglycine-generating enzyme family protein [Microbacterium sp. Leaf320]|uniref:formylglycine-generating enzyme family protein n=1 Tax=Microbacterium sp. Leaf320 TaxID=1736334 RepID=UPI0006F881E7|nr:formylglycine-generating enzyme family protein [Microbacterium sp. Leaf320]KQQ65363.1 sulfatase-modifying factor 1 [Microbacterium sp. Leaf320]